MEFKYTSHEAFGGTYDRYEYQSMIHMKPSQSKPEDFTPEIRAWRAYQVEEVKKVLSIRSYLEHANRRAEILDTLWTKEHADTAAYGRNWGYYVGMDNIRKYYVDGNKFGGKGTDICHPFTTYMIVIADDNKTAQVTWYSIGYEINPANGPETDCYWDNQRCGADLVLEDGQWKIWHYFAGTDFALRPGFPYASLKTEETTPCTSIWSRSLALLQRSLRPIPPSITTSPIRSLPWSTQPLRTPSAMAPRAIPTTKRAKEGQS